MRSTFIKPDLRASPGNPFKFKDKVNFKSKSSLKELGQGRMNKQFKSKVPYLTDPEIRESIRHFPLETAEK